MAKRIPLQNGGSALVPDREYEWIRRFNWYRHPGGYVARNAVDRGRRIVVRLFHEIRDGEEETTSPAPIASIPLDATTLAEAREAIRGATGKVRCPCCQRMVREDASVGRGKSGYVGVYATGYANKPWRAAVRMDGRFKFIGSFEDPVEAARAYDRKARELHGARARLNFPFED